MVYESWCRVREARIHLERAKRNWYDNAPRPANRGRPFCFVLRRMRRTWREVDRTNDLAGFPVHRTIGATDTRNNWSSVLYGAIRRDEVIRIRHQHEDEPALLMSESRFRALERAVPPGALGALPEPTPASRAEGAAFLTQILGPE